MKPLLPVLSLQAEEKIDNALYQTRCNNANASEWHDQLNHRINHDDAKWNFSIFALHPILINVSVFRASISCGEYAV